MIIMTSNIGARDLKDFGTGVGFATKAKSDNEEEQSKGIITKALKKTFSPEFLNRIDDVVVFNSLKKEHIFKIIDIVLRSVYKRIQELGFQITLTDAAKDFISEKGYDPNYGARPLHRAIQKYLEDPLAEEILNANLKSGDTILADFNKEENKIVITSTKPSKKKTSTPPPAAE
jgi:ATP-dependent Clp protease ATP-binding subunit ClpC